MPMPDLDPARFVPAVLSDPTHRLPMPDRGPQRFFSQDPAVPETVDTFDPFYASLFADGSIRRACPVATATAQARAGAAETPSEGELSTDVKAGMPDRPLADEGKVKPAVAPSAPPPDPARRDPVVPAA